MASKRFPDLAHPWVVQAEGELVEAPAAVARPQSFDDFFLDEHERLFKALYFVTGNREDAEELMQESFLRLWERWDDRDRIQDPTAYLFRVALNGFRMRTRRMRTAARRLIGNEYSGDPFQQIEIRVDVRMMLGRLTPRQRSALVLIDMLGYGSAQAGRIMGIRSSTVRALASQGRAALRQGETDA
jgi:RNA polymerase sigma factor (sigma-70 family)